MGEPARLECERAAVALLACPGVHPSPPRRPGVHLGGGTDDLGLPEGDGGLHRARVAGSSDSTSASTGRLGGRTWSSGPACRFRPRPPHASRSTAPTRTCDGCHTRATLGSYDAHRCALPPGRCRGCGWAITRTPRNPPRWACRSAPLCLELGRQRRDVGRRRCDCPLEEGAANDDHRVPTSTSPTATFYAGEPSARALPLDARANQPVFRDRNGLAAAAPRTRPSSTPSAIRELFSNAGGIRPDQPPLPR